MNDSLLSRMRETARLYGPVPFWSWNDRLSEEELRRQIRAMDKIGMHGFFMHARFGLETEYMSEEWFDAIRACVDEAKRLGMDAWSYDENGWPSGFAGGILLSDEDNFARYMIHAEENVFPRETDVLGVYTIEEGICRAATEEDAPPYLVIRERADSSYVDILRADIVDKFIAATHAEYKKQLGEDFGGAMPGFFTDEPQYYRYAAPYSRSLPAEFQAKYGYPLTDALAAVFWDYEGCEAHRHDYFLLLHQLYTNHFIKRIYDWCEENGCQLTGHSIVEESLSGQMMCCGGVMPFYLYEHVPGVDYLGRSMHTDIAPKQLGSVCAQTGRKKALSETFACCGWDVSPRELKRIAEMQYAGGVNLMCQHLYPYSARGQRKRDYPAHYSEHNPWFDHLADFDRHFANLGALLGEGEEYATTLVIHPIRDAYRTYKRHVGSSVSRQDGDLRALSEELGRRQIPYHYGDESILELMGEVRGKQLRAGQCLYDFVIVPKMETLSQNTVRLLREYQKNGGRLCFIGEVPGMIDARVADLSDLHSNITLDEIDRASAVHARLGGENVPGLRQRIRISDGRRIIFTANITENDYYGVTLTLQNCAGAVGVNTVTMEKFPLHGTRNPDGSLCVSLDLPASASAVILEDATARLLPVTETAKKPAIALPELFTLCEKPQNTLSMDRASLSTDGGNSWSEVRPIERIRDNLLFARYEGEVCLRYPFTVRDIPTEAELIWENASVTGVSVNGQPIAAEGFLHPDPAFSRANVAPYLQEGENEATLTIRYFQQPIVYDVLYGDVMESLRNCLNFDTEIEAIYLRGDFRIDVDREKCTDGERCSIEYSGDFPIIAPRDTIRLCDVVRDGMPFYGGAIEAEAVITWQEGEPTVLRPAGRYAVCRAWVNGEYAGEAFLADEIDLAPYLRCGENTLRIRTVSALRNTAGPFHRPDPEPLSVNPKTFSYEKEWKGGDSCEAYLPRYAFVRFGV